MTVRYAVTFESTAAPLTHRGVMQAGQAHGCAARAINVAQKILRPFNWTSMVYVALERTPGAVTWPTRKPAEATRA